MEMENFRALAVKLASSDRDRPLTESRKTLIEKRLRDFFPDFHTPNHPTYASMIYRAILELKEPEGSTEESISEFIRKQYDDLPWAHFTLLKHHLQKLCESGEIVVTSDECYLVADGITNLNSGPYSSRKSELMQQMCKGREKKLRGRARRRRKVQIKEHNQPAGEQMEGQEQVEEQHNQLIEEQNVTEEPRSDLIEELNVLCAREQEQQSVLIEEQNQLEGQVMDSEHLEQNQPESPSLERPPGFNLVKVKELSYYGAKNFQKGLHFLLVSRRIPNSNWKE
ncbi:HMG-Y-related protein A [Camellia lanceoleosa]|uniref:HMG-Y-related protein A n=1 Tax=Camellia lanceoleosa TaxID=1840588 RepID=A0ACC0G0M5_9ERIC|nr:HMG-Y-related protein A [Camellia lanceoleosa]